MKQIAKQKATSKSKPKSNTRIFSIEYLLAKNSDQL